MKVQWMRCYYSVNEKDIGKISGVSFKVWMFEICFVYDRYFPYLHLVAWRHRDDK